MTLKEFTAMALRIVLLLPVIALFLVSSPGRAEDAYKTLSSIEKQRHDTNNASINKMRQAPPNPGPASKQVPAKGTVSSKR